MRKPWHDADIEILKRLYAFNTTSSIALELNRPIHSVYSKAHSLGLSKNEHFYKSELSGRIIKESTLSVKTQFRKGNKPFNTGMKAEDFMSHETLIKFRANSYKKGHLPHNTKTDGTISLRKDKSGYSYRFIRTSIGEWEALHVYNWKQKYGPVPCGFIVVFQTADKTNYDVSNLELITRKDNMLRNTIQHYPAELRETMKALKKLTHQINGKE